MSQEQYRYEDETSDFTIMWRRVEKKFSMPHKHLHAQFEVYYLLEGERVVWVQDSSWPIRAGDAYLIRPFEMHRTSSPSGIDDEDSHERVVFHFSDGSLPLPDNRHGELIAALFQPGRPVLRLSDQARVAADKIISAMGVELDRADPYRDSMLRTLFLQLLVEFGRSRAGQTDAATTPAHLDESHDRISTVARFIQEHASKDITLEYLSRHFAVSRFHLSREFKRITGFTIGEYLRNARVQKAHHLLVESDMPIQRIALECGFGSLSQFGRIFRRLRGSSPRDIRSGRRRTSRIAHFCVDEYSH